MISSKIVSLVVLVSFFGSLCSKGDPPDISGGGNVPVGSDPMLKSQYAALHDSGARAIRMTVYPYDYYDGVKALPEKADTRVLEAHAAGVRKIILLFEYYGHFQTQARNAIPLGSEDKWRQIGQAFAARFAPNSPWLKSHGISDWGITIFQAFNEPDLETPENTMTLTGPSSYYAAMKGLADGIHSVAGNLAVIPGGFGSPNASSNFTLNGLGLALAPLWNDGTLDGIDLHTYNDIQYAPIIRRDGRTTNDFSPQSNFDRVKAACHITRDINFYTTEYNFKANEQGIDEALAAKRLLTCIWANLGIVKNDGKTSATRLALIWNLFNHTDQDRTYGINLKSDAWEPTRRGETFRLVMTLTKGMDFTSLDPKGRGEFILEGTGKKLWVWQNYEHWTDTPGESFALQGIPATATKLEVYGWDGLRRRIPVSGQTAYEVTGLVPGETYMVLAEP